MTPHGFIAKWRGVELKERTASQTHFNDLCALLGEPDPVSADKTGEWFTFEKGASKTTGGKGWADVWRKECFAWEYKGKRKDLDSAFRQLLNYSIALENPPLLIVSDMERIRVHTNWTNTVQQVHEIALDELADAAKRDILKFAFTDPERLRPTKTRQMLTEEAAKKFASLAQRLRERGHAPETVAHFVNRLVFCMFAEDVQLLPNKMFERLLKHSQNAPQNFAGHAWALFGAMKSGGMVGFEKVEWFNGGLFDTDEALPMDATDVNEVLAAAKLDWSDIDPSILGTLFERGLDPEKRSQLGAHYTDSDKIMLIVNAVIFEPLTAEWEPIRAEIKRLIENAPKATSDKLLRGSELAARTRAFNQAERLQREFIDRLKDFRVLDPACGSGNFLYLSLLALKDLEHKANLEAEVLGLPRGFPSVGPESVKGIEMNHYAAELARVSVWIGEIQWMRRNGFEAARNPILRPLGTIECRDAILNPDGTETDWPVADVIVGNPPFLGAKIMKGSLGVEETQRIRTAFKGRLPGFTDLVCYWFEKARAEIVNGRAQRAGLVATNSIAKNTNLPVLRRICAELKIYRAFSDMSWVVDGAAVRVAILCFSNPDSISGTIELDGEEVESVNPNLTSGIDFSSLAPIQENRNVSFVGIQKSGPFDIPGSLARKWLNAPLNPNGRSNRDVLRPTFNGNDLTSTRRDTWLIDFPRGLSEADAALWEAPFQYLCNALYDPHEPDLGLLKEFRRTVRDVHPREQWWTTYWPRPEVRKVLKNLNRFIVTPMTSEHRVFIWGYLPTIPDNNTIIITRDDDVSFGLLHSRVHEVWSTLIGNRMGVGNQRRYNSATVFETFPFPEGLTPDIPAAEYADDPRAQRIAAAAARLNELRENWLNPPDLVEWVPEVVPGYPDRIVPVDDKAATILKKRTLTNLYNERPAWLKLAHTALDEAVAEAYGWGDDWRADALIEDEILARLFQFNQVRVAGQTT